MLDLIKEALTDGVQVVYFCTDRRLEKRGV